MRTFALTALLALPAFAQAPQPTQLPEWFVPIHTAPDDPELGAYGIWAAGPDYKVSFHDGFVFYPVLGDSYPENLPLRWKTEAVVAGGQVLVDADTRAQARHTDWHYEYRYPGVVEAYDVRRNGVEQTFTIERRPSRSGDVVVQGRFDTKLRSGDRLAAHDKLVFHDDQGNALVEYGAAVAVDARGNRHRMTTSIEAGRVQLTVDGAWLDRATYPIVIDPVTSVVTLPGTGSKGDADIAHSGSDWFQVETRYVSLNDWDARGVLLSDDFSTATTVFTDLSGSWDTTDASVAWVDGAEYGELPVPPFGPKTGRWAAAITRSTSLVSGVRVYVHDGDSESLNSGTVLGLSTPANTLHYGAGIGGVTTSGEHALVAFEAESNSSFTSVGVVLLDCSDDLSSDNFGTVTMLDGSVSDPAEAISVTRTTANDSTSWIVVWDSGFVNNVTLKAARITSNGTALPTHSLGSYDLTNGTPLRPHVGGRGGRYLVTVRLASQGIEATRLDWAESSANAITQPAVLIPSNLGYFQGSGHRGVGFDTRTQSHWLVSFTDADTNMYVHRVGLTGHEIETLPTGMSGRSGSVCFNPNSGEFAVTIAGEAVRYLYPADAGSSTYGSGCGGTIAITNNGLAVPPYTGSEFLRIELTGGLPSVPSILALSASSGGLQLSNSCWINLSFPIVSAGQVVSDTNGDATIGPFALPADPLFVVDFYWQWIQIGGPGFGAWTTEGLKTSHR